MSQPVSPTHAHTHESHSIRGYLFVYFALLVGTVLTVWASYIDLGHHWNIVLALVIACIKAFLVIAYFMHLISEKKMIFLVMSFTMFFFAGLMVLTLCSMHNFPRFTVTH
jgi:cytochrome c oxidase subunit 4